MHILLAYMASQPSLPVPSIVMGFIGAALLIGPSTLRLAARWARRRRSAGPGPGAAGEPMSGPAAVPRT